MFRSRWVPKTLIFSDDCVFVLNEHPVRTLLRGLTRMRAGCSLGEEGWLTTRLDGGSPNRPTSHGEAGPAIECGSAGVPSSGSSPQSGPGSPHWNSEAVIRSSRPSVRTRGCQLC